jgi:2-dehydro-3-deoxygluconokinase
MLAFASNRVVAVGEAMIEMAPAGSGLYRQGYAGDTFNTVWHMAQLLGDAARVGFVTRIGTDRLSDTFASEMTCDGLDTSGLIRDAERRMGLYVIELDGAERSFHYWRQNSAARHLVDDPAEVRVLLKDAGLVHLSGITLAILAPDARENLFRELSEARRAGAIVSFDPNVRPALWPSREETQDTISRMLGITDIALPSFDDEANLWGDGSPVETLKRIGSHGVLEIVVKNGPNPVFFAIDGRTGNSPTPLAERIVDTTGAGDSFNAGYLAARLVEKSFEQAIALGQRLSAEVIGSLGARAPREAVRDMNPFVR